MFRWDVQFGPPTQTLLEIKICNFLVPFLTLGPYEEYPFSDLASIINAHLCKMGDLLQASTTQLIIAPYPLAPHKWGRDSVAIYWCSLQLHHMVLNDNDTFYFHYRPVSRYVIFHNFTSIGVTRSSLTLYVPSLLIVC